MDGLPLHAISESLGLIVTGIQPFCPVHVPCPYCSFNRIDVIGRHSLSLAENMRDNGLLGCGLLVPGTLGRRLERVCRLE